MFGRVSLDEFRVSEKNPLNAFDYQTKRVIFLSLAVFSMLSLIYFGTRLTHTRSRPLLFGALFSAFFGIACCEFAFHTTFSYERPGDLAKVRKWAQKESIEKTFQRHKRESARVIDPEEAIKKIEEALNQKKSFREVVDLWRSAEMYLPRALPSLEPYIHLLVKETDNGAYHKLISQGWTLNELVQLNIIDSSENAIERFKQVVEEAGFEQLVALFLVFSEDFQRAFPGIQLPPLPIDRLFKEAEGRPLDEVFRSYPIEMIYPLSPALAKRFEPFIKSFFEKHHEACLHLHNQFLNLRSEIGKKQRKAQNNLSSYKKAEAEGYNALLTNYLDMIYAYAALKVSI
jgi:hypothetical protein